MSERELLEMAAKAAEYKMHPETFIGDYWLKDGMVWNPLTDDGDALRLVVKLGIVLSRTQTDVLANRCKELIDTDSYSATRRAIVRAAAEIGRNMK